MNRYSWLEGYLLSMPGAVTDYKLEWQWQRYLVGGRMFAAQDRNMPPMLGGLW